MNWFERHLNWSLFIAWIPLPFAVNLIILLILLSIFGSQFAMFFQNPELMYSDLYFLYHNAGALLPLFVISGVVNFALSIFFLVVVWWYLGRKGRSKGFFILIVGPFVFTFIISFFNSDFGRLLGGLGFIAGVIVLLLLENQATTYDADFIRELETSRGPDIGQPDIGQFDEHYDRQWKELERKNFEAAREFRNAGGEVPAEPVEQVPAGTIEEVPAETIEEVPAEATAEAAVESQVTQPVISLSMSSVPILLDDTGAVMKCFYHPDAEAVNSCSRCGQCICSACNYVTGTHPICRNCWDKRAEMPMAAPAKKQEGPKLGKWDKRKTEEDERLREFMLLYEQALPVISAVVKKGADGLPASPLDLMEGLKLRPMLEHAKKLPKPRSKELQEAKKDFEQLLVACIKVAETAADFVSLGGQAIPAEADFARLASGIEKASVLTGELYQRVASLSQPQA